MQHTGSFKVRAALGILGSLPKTKRSDGVITISAGNHAIATAYAANYYGIDAKVIIPSFANPFRIKACASYGATIIHVENFEEGFSLAKKLEKEESRYFLHPFEGFGTTLGTATLGLEFYQQASVLDCIIAPVGGGGLISGLAVAAKALNPKCQVFGVEPQGAATLSHSLKIGFPGKIPALHSIADSLCVPHSEAYSFHLTQSYVDDVVTVTDSQILESMRILLEEHKLAVEPAAATGLAGLLGPLKLKTHGKKIGVVICGSNIDTQSYLKLLQENT